MTVRTAGWLLTVVLLAVGTVRSEDSQETLAAAAAREKARRAAQKAKSVKKFTDEDLKKLGGKPGAKPAAAASTQQASPDGGAPEGAPSDSSRAEFWRPRVDPARAEVVRCEAVVSGLEARLQELRMSQTRPVRLGEPNRDLAIMHDIQSTLEEMETAKHAVDEAKQALEDIIEEARRAGVPASQLE